MGKTTEARKLKKLAKDYLKRMNRTFFDSFLMGLRDGAKGNEQPCPPLPQPDTGLNYAGALFALELYKKGYRAGRR